MLLQGWIQRAGRRRPAEARRPTISTPSSGRRGPPAFKPIDLKAQPSPPTSPVKLDAHHQPQRARQAHRRPNIPTRRVMFGAHWDAFGIGPPDAAGPDHPPRRRRRRARRRRRCSRSRACSRPGRGRSARSSSPPGPPRSAACSGTEYYAQHPLFPHGHDGREPHLRHAAVRRARSATSVLVGRGQSEMEDDLAAAAKAQGRYVTPENHPERGAVLPRRPFLLRQARRAGAARYGARRRVRPGRRRPSGGRALARRLHRRCYHQTCDAWSAELEPARRSAGGRAVLRNRRRALANSRDWPQWRSTSEFAKVRAQSASARSTGRRKGERGR